MLAYVFWHRGSRRVAHQAREDAGALYALRLQRTPLSA